MPLRLIMFTSLSRRVSSLGSVYWNMLVVVSGSIVFGSDVVNLVLLMSGVWLCMASGSVYFLGLSLLLLVHVFRYSFSLAFTVWIRLPFGCHWSSDMACVCIYCDAMPLRSICLKSLS